jgi:hypothetical protein
LQNVFVSDAAIKGGRRFGRIVAIVEKRLGYLSITKIDLELSGRELVRIFIFDIITDKVTIDTVRMTIPVYGM